MMTARLSLCRVLFLSLFLLLSTILAPTAQAIPITITQTFGPALSNLTVNGTSTAVTGDWVFTILTDTTNPDLSTDSRFGLFAASITVSNSGLGLSDVSVLSHVYYFEFDLNNNGQNAGSGITSQTFNVIGGNTGVLMEGTGGGNVINDPNIIEPSFLDYVATSYSFFTFLVTNSNPLQLADGTTIEGESLMLSGTQSTVQRVPEPSSLLVLISGLAGLGLLRRPLKADPRFMD